MPEDISLVKTELLVEDKAHDIVYLLSLYPDVVATAYKTNEPSAIVTFAFKLAHAISSAWDGRESSLPSRPFITSLFLPPFLDRLPSLT